MSTPGTASLVVVGSGFASTLFLHRYLSLAEPSARVVVLERGPRRSHRQLLAERQDHEARAGASFVNRTPEKPWIFSLLFGGGSNTWFGNTPRFLPEDFELESRFGRGTDWPLSYEELEPYYCDAEDLLGVAGPAETPAPRSRPYALPAHALSEPDRVLAAGHPGAFFALPSARPSRAVGGRPRCCASGYCNHCPVNSKMTVPNTLAGVYDDPRVTLVVGAEAERVDTRAGRAVGVVYRRGRDAEPHLAAGEQVALGANALFNPFLLQRSGLDGPVVGTGLTEQVGVLVDVHLDGLDGFQGGTSHTGHGYMLYGGDFAERRRERAAALLETWNVPLLRPEPGRWRQRLVMKLIYEDHPSPGSRVEPDPADPRRPAVSFAGPSKPTVRALAELDRDLEAILAPLPVEAVHPRRDPVPSEAHLLCTTPLGRDPKTSVVDRHLIHHQVRNLFVLGGSVFPTCPPANPTLTLSALSLWAAQAAFGGAS